MPVFNNILAGASGAVAGYDIERSLRFNSVDSATLTRTFSSGGNLKTWSWNCWFKRVKLDFNSSLLAAYSSGSVNSYVRFTSSNFLDIYFRDGAGSQVILTTDQVFRDTSSWYALTMIADTTQSAASNRFKVYINGSQITSFSSSTYPALNADLSGFNGAFLHSIGDLAQSTQYFDGYTADVNFVDGQALAPTAFGELDSNNVWQPKRFSGTYGTNGFHLNFADNSSVAALGTDTSGNNNSFTVNNLSVTAGLDNDSLRDSPINGDPTGDTGVGGEISSNYAILSAVHNSGTNVRLGEGGLEFFSYDGNYQGVVATIAMTHKTYWETKFSDALSLCQPGIIRADIMPIQSGGARLGYSAAEYPNSASIWPDGQACWYNGVSTFTTGAIWSAGDVIGHAYDPATGNYYGWRNGAALNSGNPVATLDTSYTYAPAVVTAQSSLTNSINFNFGQRPFVYGNAGTNRADASYKCLCTSNLPEPTIADSSLYFDTKLWTGSSSPQTITYPFTPDFAWVKSRNQGYHNILLDTVRGDNKVLTADYNGAEQNNPSFAGGEFSGNDLILPSKQNVNSNGNTFVGWAWDAGETTTTIAVGGLNSSVYDQSQTWSSLITPYLNSPLGSGDGTQIFDGSSSTQTTSNNTSGAGIKFTPTSNITGIIELWLRNGDTANSTFSYSVDGGSNFTNVTTVGGSGSYVNIGQQTITTTNGLIVRHITTAGTNGVSWRRMRVSGKELIDYGVSVPNVPTIASEVRASAASGFSIVKYVGNDTANTTIGHNLNAVPSLIIVKPLSSSGSAPVYTSTIGNGSKLYLDTNVAASGSSNWNNTDPTSHVFSVIDSSETNANSTSYIAYCFAPVDSYSAMGSYEGNGNANGSFVYCGFKPGWILIKNADDTENWYIYDSKRSPNNVAYQTLQASSAGAEETGNTNSRLDLLSNGFKLRQSNGPNNNNNTYIYLAIAETPFKTARAR